MRHFNKESPLCLHNSENENAALMKTLTFITPLRCSLEYFDEICPKTGLPVDFSIQYFAAKFLEKQRWPALSNGYY